jgi:hypothetical protein
MRLTSTVLAALSVIIPATAAANPIAYDGDGYYAQPTPPPPDPNPENHVQPELAVGFLIGNYSVGPISGPAYGLQVAGGAHYRRWLLQGEYDLLGVGESSYQADGSRAVRGLVHRLGANLRFSFASISKKDFPLRGDFWVEAGAGRQFLRWYDGGKLTRNDLAFGLGGQMSVRWGKDKRKKAGLFYALKVIGSRRADLKMLPETCAGPCDEPTGPIPYDLGIFFDVAIIFGR